MATIRVIDTATGAIVGEYEVPPIEEIEIQPGQRIEFVDVNFGDPEDPDVILDNIDDTDVQVTFDGGTVLLQNFYFILENADEVELAFADSLAGEEISSLDGFLATAAGGAGAGGAAGGGGTGADGTVNLGDLNPNHIGATGVDGVPGTGVTPATFELPFFDDGDEEEVPAVVPEVSVRIVDISVLPPDTEPGGDPTGDPVPPGVGGTAVDVPEPVEGAQTVIFVVQLSEPTSVEVTVQLQFVGGTAIMAPQSEGGDFIDGGEPFTLIFPPGTTTATVPAEVFADNLIENVEDFFIQIIDATNAEVDPSASQANVSIIDPDFATFSITGPDQLTEETLVESQTDTTKGEWTISYSGGEIDPNANPPITLSVDVTTAGIGENQATEGADYTLLLEAIAAAADQVDGIDLNGNTLTFSAGAPNFLTFELMATPDLLVEGTESFEVRISNPSDRAVIASDGEVVETDIVEDEAQGTIDAEGPVFVSEDSQPNQHVGNDGESGGSFDFVLNASDNEQLVSVTLNNIPNGVRITDGSQTVVGNGSNSITIAAGDLPGTLFQADNDSDLDFEISFSAVIVDPDTGEEVTIQGDGPLSVVVDAVADQPTFVEGDPDDSTIDINQVITVTVTATFDDVSDGSEDRFALVELPQGWGNTDGLDVEVIDSTTAATYGVPEGTYLRVEIDDADMNGNVGTAQVRVTTPNDIPVDEQTNEAEFLLDVIAKTVDTPEGGGDQEFNSANNVSYNDADNPVRLTFSDINGEISADATVIEDSQPNQDTGDTTVVAAALNINFTPDDFETLVSVTIEDIPNGVSITDVNQSNTVVGNGSNSITIAAADIGNVTITLPDTDSDVDFDLSLSAVIEQAGNQRTITGLGDVRVDADADKPSLDLDSQTGGDQLVGSASGDEDTAIDLDVSAALNDTDLSETLSIVISGVPTGASLNNGSDNGDGSYTLSSGDLAGLQITPATNDDTNFALTVTAIATESNPENEVDSPTASTTGTINVTVNAVADPPDLVVSSDGGLEDQSIPVSITATLVDTDGSESITSIVISSVPSGATLSAGTNNGDGSWTLSTGQLAGLTITPPTHSDVDMNLSITAVTTDTGGVTASTTKPLTVTVDAVADAPTLDLDSGTGGNQLTGSATGNEDTAIALDISTALVDTDGSETIDEIIISGVPTGASLNKGTDNGDGSYTLSTGDLAGLTITPATNDDTNFALTVTSITKESNPENVVDTLTASTTGTINVTVNAVADPPNLVVSSDGGLEDQSIPVSITATLVDTDGSESITSIVISSVPSGATLSAGTNNGDGSWTLSTAQLAGLTITPPTHSDVDMNLSITAVTTDTGGVTASTTKPLTVTVDAVADAPTLNLSDASGNEDTPIALSISTALVDTDGSETIDEIIISGVPTGSTLNNGTDNGDGSWTLSTGDLAGLTITVGPEHTDQDVQLTVTSITKESNPENEVDTLTASTTGTIDVTVAAVADAPELAILGLVSVEGIGDALIADKTTGVATVKLDIDLVDQDGSEEITDITLSGIADGATLFLDNDGNGVLSAGDTELTVTGGSATIPTDATTVDDGDPFYSQSFLDQLEAGLLKYVPPVDTSDPLPLTVTVTTSEITPTVDGPDSSAEVAVLTASTVQVVNVVPPPNLLEGSIITNTNNADQEIRITFTQLTNPANTFSTILILDQQGQGVNFVADVGFAIDPSEQFLFTLDWEDPGASNSDFIRLISVELEGQVLFTGNVKIGDSKSQTMTAVFSPDDGLATAEPDDPTGGSAGTSVSEDPNSPGTSVTNGADSATVAAGSSIADLQDLTDTTEEVPLLYGGDGDDTLSSGDNSGVTAIDGGAGNDIITGGNDFDLLVGDEGDDTISGGGGNDALHGNEGADSMMGGAGADGLLGGAGNDELSGDGGNDMLSGGLGTDTLTGGAGNDAFKFDGSNLDVDFGADSLPGGGDDTFSLDTDAGVDLIVDFHADVLLGDSSGEEDVLDLADVIVPGFDPASDDILDFLKLENDLSGNLKVSVSVNGDGTDFTQVALLQGITLANFPNAGTNAEQEMLDAGNVILDIQ